MIITLRNIRPHEIATLSTSDDAQQVTLLLNAVQRRRQVRKCVRRWCHVAKEPTPYQVETHQEFWAERPVPTIHAWDQTPVRNLHTVHYSECAKHSPITCWVPSWQVASLRRSTVLKSPLLCDRWHVEIVLHGSSEQLRKGSSYIHGGVRNGLSTACG